MVTSVPMNHTTTVSRRTFLKSAAIAGGGLLILPSGIVRAKAGTSPNEKLNIALIGAYGRAEAHWDGLAKENVVALCDINENNLAKAVERFPKAKTYFDWREAIDHKGIDAVVCCTLDHTHAFVANWALNRDLHCYCEKPLAISVEEARVVRANYLKKKNKLATQVGTQRHQFENFNRVREAIRDGVIGELREVSAWGDRQIRRPGYPKAAGDPPSHIHYDLWIGPSPFHPYNPEYFSGGPGANCLQWNMYWDFGTGQVGDMGSHTMDLVWDAIDAGAPISAEAKGDPFNPEVTPVALETHFKHPANDWRPAIDVAWYQGGLMPENPINYFDLHKIDHGAMFEGSKGTLVANFDTRIIIPNKNDGNMTYYHPRSQEQVLKPIGDFQREWINACKGSLKTSCDFDYSGTMMEQMMLGLVAYRVGKKLDYDPAKGEVTNCPEANALLKRSYRQGWTLNG